MRRFLYPVRLAGARLRHRAGLAVLVGTGVAVGAGALAAVLAGSLVAQDRALGRDLERLDPAQRVLRVSWGGVPGQTSERFASLDTVATRALGRLAHRPPFATAVFRESTVGGAITDLAAIEGVRNWVRLRSGRYPRECRPSRCELIQVGGRGAAPSDPSLHLVVVGTGTLVSDIALGSDVGARLNPAVEQAATYHAARDVPILVADGVSSLAVAPFLSDLYRSYSWIVPLQRGDVHAWSVGSFQSRVTQAQSELGSKSEFFGLEAPIDAVQAASDSSTVAGRRLLLIGGEAAALLLAFALLAAASGSRRNQAAMRRLTWLGASPTQRGLVFAAESVAIAVVGSAVGWAAGAAVAAGIADAAGSPAAAVLRHSVLSGAGIAAAAGMAAASTLVLLLSLWRPQRRVGPLTVTAIDVAAIGALVAVVLALVRGSADSQSIAQEQGTGVVLLLLPGLVAFIAAVLCVRLLPSVLRLLERLSRRSIVPLRLASVSLARNPGRSAIAVSFLVVSIGLAAFAGAYRSTLTRNQSDEAAYSVPLTATLQEDFTQGVYPLDAAPLGAYSKLGPGVTAYPVTRVQGDASGGGQLGTTILGVPVSAIAKLHWRSDFSPTSRSGLAKLLRPHMPVAIRGLRIPAGAQRLLLPVRVIGDGVAISASIETRGGDFELVSFGPAQSGYFRAAGPATTHVLPAELPANARGGLITGFTFDLPTTGTRVFVPQLQGTLVLGRLRAVGPGVAATLPPYTGWIGIDGAHPIGSTGATTRIRYVVTPALQTRFRPPEPSDGKPILVVVSPNLAASAGPGGVLPVQIVDQQFLARVVGVARRFPTLTGSFVVADEQWLTGVLNGAVPGSGQIEEVWVDGGRDPSRIDAALTRAPFDLLQLQTYSGAAEELRADPLSRGTLITLAAAAIVALALALGGLLLAVISDLRDERGELNELEAQGAAPADLRRLLRLRALVVAAVGVAGGLATGAVLSTLVVSVVRLTAGADTPVPPLRLDLDWTLLGAAFAAYTVAAVGLVGLVTWAAFRAPVASTAEAVS
jgi:hypothetical protein